MTIETVRLGEVADYIRGITFKPADVVPPHSPESVVCMTTKNVQATLDESKLTAVPPRFVKRKEQYLQAGDILISSANSWNLVGKASFVPELPYTAAAGGFISILRARRDRIDPRYLYHWMASGETQHRARLCARQTTNIANLDRERFLRLEAPLPPLPEQRRIAAILDKADAIRRKHQQTLNLTDQFLRSAFLDMFGDPVTNPKGWKTPRLGDVCSRITDGTHQPPVWSEEGYPFLFVSNIVNGAISFETKKHISEETWRELTRRCPIEMNDILYTTVGSYGNSALVDTKRRFAFQRHIAHIKPDVSLIHPEFLVGMLQSPAVRAQADRAVKGIAQKTLNLGDLKVFKIFVPPRDVQEMYVGLRRRALEQRLSAVSTLACADELGNSLMQRAFRGEL